MSNPAPRPRQVRSQLLRSRVLAAFRSRLLCIAEGSAYCCGGSVAPDRSTAVLTDLSLAYGVLKLELGNELLTQELFSELCKCAAGFHSHVEQSRLGSMAKTLYSERISRLTSLFGWQDFLAEHFLAKPAHGLSQEQAELRRAIAFVFALDAELLKESLLVALGHKFDLAQKIEEREQHACLLDYKYGCVNKLELGLEQDEQIPAPPARGPIRSSKRIFDVATTLLVLLLISPLFIMIVLFQAFDDGPMFYGQRRIGQGGNIFRCWKFRTMIPNAEAVLADILARDPVAQAEWTQYEKLRNDPRITRLGGFLRRTSLDELPQLFNVLNGDMSLVGPRPMAVHERDRWGPYYRLYKQVRPGVTGPWQISYRTDSCYETRITCLEEYLARWSLLADVKYLFLTLKVPFAKTGAY